MEFDFRSAIELLTAFQAFLFALYLFTLKEGQRISNYFIAIFLFLLGLNLIQSVIDFYISDEHANISAFLTMLGYLMTPSLYFYIKSSLEPRFTLSRKDLVHLIPYVVFNLLIFPSVYLENFKDVPAEPENNNTINLILYLGFYAQAFYYLISAFFLLTKTKKLYLENFSNTDTRRYEYLFQLNTMATIVFVFSAIKNLIFRNIEETNINFAVYLVLFSVLILFCWIIIKGLQSPELFREYDNLKPVKDLIKQEEIKDIGLIEEVQKYMDDEEPYLDASLSLYDLAKQINKPTRELSLLINHHLNKHFFDFVNQYRIEKAMRILKDATKSKLTIQEIFYDVGFNSKSSFNTAFKKHSGFTPTQYRKNNI